MDDEDFEAQAMADFEATYGGGLSDEDIDQSVQQDIAAAAAQAAGVDIGGYGFDPGFSASDYSRDIVDAQRAVMGIDPRISGLGQIPSRLEQARAGYGIPSLLGKGLGLLGSFNLNNLQRQLSAGGRPVFDRSGKLQGVFSPGLFGFGEVYSGMPVEGVPGTGYDMGGNDGAEEIIPEVEEPVVEEELPAEVAAARTYEPGAYARMGLLDVAPPSLGAFQRRYGVGFGTPMEFADANLVYRRPVATYPERYRAEPQLTGYTLLA